jgi:hypothetical protein
MSLLEMQRAISEILTNASLRDRFLKNPEEICMRYNLNSNEFNSLKAINKERLSIYSVSLQHGRLRIALKAFPLTAKLLVNKLSDLTPRYCQEYAPISVSGSLLNAEALRFYDFMMKLLNTGEITDKYIKDVINYEKIIFFLESNYEAQNNNQYIAETQLTVNSLHQYIPIKCQNMQVYAFSHNIVDLIATIKNGELPLIDEENHCLILFFQSSSSTVNIKRINEMTHNLLNLCDGQCSVQRILDQIVNLTGIVESESLANLSIGVVKVLNKLQKSGIILFKNKP